MRRVCAHRNSRGRPLVVSTVGRDNCLRGTPSNGGQVRWETMLDQSCLPRRRPGRRSHVRLHRTNLTTASVHQVGRFRQWWAKSEDLMNVGLAARFSMSFASDGPPGPTSLDGFARDVAWPAIKDIFRAILKQLGPKTPHGHRHLAWPLTDRLRRYTESVRQVCFQAKKRPSRVRSDSEGRAFEGGVLGRAGRLVVQCLRASGPRGVERRVRQNTPRHVTSSTFGTCLGCHVLDQDIKKNTWNLSAGQEPVERGHHPQ